MSCAGATYGKCLSPFDCPTGMSCGSFGSNWCGVDAQGVCSYGVGGLLGDPAANCVSDQDCTVPRDNTCVICGNGTFDSDMGKCGSFRCRQEYCDDGNQADGDLCSSKCQASGVCTLADGTALTSPSCYTAADCGQAYECEFQGPCTCNPQ